MKNVLNNSETSEITHFNRGDIYMKRRFIWIFIPAIFVLCILSVFGASPFLWAGVANTKHNLSVSGTGAIKATAETEICVFCHLPHNANPAVPLWSHNVSSAAYTMYNSEYLNRARYVVPTALGTYPNTGYRSRLCLSCHDGTVAIGQIYVLRGTKLSSPVNMQGTTNGYIPTSSSGYLGTDLTNDHPVAIVYDTTKTITFGSGTRNIELKSPAPSINPSPYEGVKLFSPSPGYVECPSCHDPHVENQKFLVIWNTNLATTIGDLCNTCHDKINWTSNIHNTAASAYTDTSVQTNYGANTIASLVCLNCHQPHGGQGSPYWYTLRQQEETTCFKGAASAATGAPCHGTGAASGGKVIESLFSRSYKHPTTSITGVHTDLDVLATQTGTKSFNWSLSKHAECVDCHNPHQAASAPARVAASSWYPSTNDSTSNLTSKSGSLTGVTGVEPTTEPNWTPPTAYTTYNAATYEYQICFKCHSYFALQDADGITTFTTASGATVTDQAMEFSTGIKSVHPVRVGLSSQTGSGTPKALTSSQMSSPWNTNLGTQTMYCSDCHGADSENSTDPKGPHGATYKYMLKGTGKYWPASSSSTLFSLNDIKNNQNNWSTELFCVNCHPMYSGGTWYSKSHNEHEDRQLGPDNKMSCVYCHVAVPHGSDKGRLIGYSTDPAPYNYSNRLRITSFTKANGPNAYQKNNCSTVTGCH